MPIQRCQLDGEPGWRWGRRGKCYTGPDARAKAAKQAEAIRSSGYTENQARNPLRADPSRTATLRRKFQAEFTKRFGRLKTAILHLVAVEDAFGLREERRREQRAEVAVRDGIAAGVSGVGAIRNMHSGGTGVGMVSNIRWRFATSSEQLNLFRAWLETQIATEILAEATAESGSEGYWRAYVQEGYQKGAARAFDDTRKAALWSGGEGDFFNGTKEEFLRSAFARPVSTDKVKLLAGRVFTDLRNVTEAMAADMQRTLADGLVEGRNPLEIARRMNKAVDGIGKVRARTIARTEIIRAHAEGQLDAMERLGVDEVGVMVEWSTADDDRVCPLCQPMDGVVLTIKEARGILPRHPNCRCVHIPANVGESHRGQDRSKTDITKSIRQSIKAEIPKRSKRSVATQKALSKWQGAGKTIRKQRPKAPVSPAKRG